MLLCARRRNPDPILVIQPRPRRVQPYRKPAALHAAPCFSSEPSAPPPPSINICQPGGHVVLVHGERPDGLLEHMYAPIRRTIASAVSAVAGANGCQLHVFFGPESKLGQLYGEEGASALNFRHVEFQVAERWRGC